MLSYLVGSLLGKEKAKKEILKLIPKGSFCAEVGVWKGKYSREILKTTKPAKLYLIDPWKFYPTYKNRWYGGTVAADQKDMDRIYKETREMFKKYRGVQILRMTSDKALAKIKDKSLDFTYIDANHSYKYVKADLEGYWRKTKIGGIVAGDDLLWGIREGFPVLRALLAFYIEKRNKLSIISLKGNQYMLRKKS